MKSSGKNQWILILSAIIGIFVLLAVFSGEPAILQIRQEVIRWAMLVAAVVLFLAILDFISARIRGLGERNTGFAHNFITIALFLAVVIYGLATNLENPMLQSYVFTAQTAIESTLAGLICVALVYGIYRVARMPGSRMRSSFLLSAIVFLLIFSGGLAFVKLSPTLESAITLVKSLPLGGMFGLLIGLAIGGLVIGIRVLFLGQHPYNGRKQ